MAVADRSGHQTNPLHNAPAIPSTRPLSEVSRGPSRRSRSEEARSRRARSVHLEAPTRTKLDLFDLILFSYVDYTNQPENP